MDSIPLFQGKRKNAFLNAGIFCIILHFPRFGIEWRMIVWVLFWIGTVLALGSGIQYLLGFFRRLRMALH